MFPVDLENHQWSWLLNYIFFWLCHVNASYGAELVALCLAPASVVWGYECNMSPRLCTFTSIQNTSDRLGPPEINGDNKDTCIFSYSLTVNIFYLRMYVLLYWGMNLGHSTVELHYQSLVLILRQDLSKLLRLTSNFWPSCLGLPSGWDYKPISPQLLFLTVFKCLSPKPLF